MTPKFYYSPFSPVSRNVLITAELLNIKLDKQVIDQLKAEHLSDEYTKINPGQNLPTLEDDGILIRESRVIMIYLVQKYAPNSSLYPSDLVKKLKVDEALYFDCGHVFACLLPLKHSGLIEKRKPNDLELSFVEKNLDKLEKRISYSNTKFLAGDQLTLADISTITTVTSIQSMGLFDFNSKPKILEWISNVKSEIDNAIWDEYIVKAAEHLKEMSDKMFNQN